MLGRNAALLVVDMQQGFDDPAWGPRNNPALEVRIAALMSAWRMIGAPLVHVHHDSPSPEGRLRRGTPGHAPKPETRPMTGEAVYDKRVNSAFIGTALETDLRHSGVEAVVIVGLTTNHCISTTARMAANLGFATLVAADATATFDQPDLCGRIRPAEAVHLNALSDLNGEFATVVESAAVLASIRGGVLASLR